MPRPGEMNNLAKLSEGDIRKIRALHPRMKLKSIASLYGVTRQNISCIVKRKTWKHIK